MKEKPNLKEIEKREQERKEKFHRKTDQPYQMTKDCPNCGGKMVYVYGELFECTTCKAQELTDFGKVRAYLEKNGPQPAAIIARATNVSMNVIKKFLYQGRVEIPDGSDIYIRCQMCGTEIRYGRFCLECSRKRSNGKNVGFVNEDVGEKPKHKREVDGRMHTLDEERVRRKNKK